MVDAASVRSQDESGAVPAQPDGDAVREMAREIANLKQGLGLLGVKPCSVCGRFFLGSDPGSFFTAGRESVCYGCLPGWWPGCCQHLDTGVREPIEYKLKDWLIHFHGGKTYRELKELPAAELQNVRVVVSCRECKGSGAMGGDRCRHCSGNGTVWVITLK
jgi:hypothetical protein